MSVWQNVCLHIWTENNTSRWKTILANDYRDSKRRSIELTVIFFCQFVNYLIKKEEMLVQGGRRWFNVFIKIVLKGKNLELGLKNHFVLRTKADLILKFTTDLIFIAKFDLFLPNTLHWTERGLKSNYVAWTPSPPPPLFFSSPSFYEQSHKN